MCVCVCDQPPVWPALPCLEMSYMFNGFLQSPPHILFQCLTQVEEVIKKQGPSTRGGQVLLCRLIQAALYKGLGRYQEAETLLLPLTKLTTAQAGQEAFVIPYAKFELGCLWAGANLLHEVEFNDPTLTRVQIAAGAVSLKLKPLKPSLQQSLALFQSPAQVDTKSDQNSGLGKTGPDLGAKLGLRVDLPAAKLMLFSIRGLEDNVDYDFKTKLLLRIRRALIVIQEQLQ